MGLAQSFGQPGQKGRSRTPILEHLTVQDHTGFAIDTASYYGASNKVFSLLNNPGTTVLGSANQSALNVQVFVPNLNASGAAFQKTAVLGETYTSSSSDANERAGVGVQGNGTVYGGATTGAGWGLVGIGTVSSGSDGKAYGAELDVYNSGTDQASLFTTTSKYGLVIGGKFGTQPISAGFLLGNGVAAEMHQGIYTDPAFYTTTTDNVFNLNGLLTLKANGAIASTASQAAYWPFFSATNSSSNASAIGAMQVLNDLGHGASIQMTSSGFYDFANFTTTGLGGMQFGTTSNAPLVIISNATSRFTLSAAGGLFSTNATGGDKGVESINSKNGYYNNGNSAVEGALQVSGLLGAATSTASATLKVACTTMVNAGTFTDLSCTTDFLTACTTAPAFNVRNNTGSTTGTAKSCGTAAGVVSQAQTLSFNAGDQICIVRTTNGATCTAPGFQVSAHWKSP